MVIVTATSSRRRDTEPELVLEDAAQVAALKSAAFRSLRTAGLGPDRAAVVAEHLAAHLPGQLAQHGYALRVEWTSAPAREAMVASGRVWDPPLVE